MTRQNATVDATRDTTKRDTVTFEEAAHHLGVSLRTVQRRVRTGDLSTIERGGARLVCLESDATEAATTRQVDATESDNDATKHDSSHDTTGKLLAHLQTENEYLKEQVNAWRLQAEAANRQASETSAALRKALDAMPKMIEAGSGSTPTEGRENSLQTPPSGEPARPTGKTVSASQRQTSREMRPLWKVILGVR